MSRYLRDVLTAFTDEEGHASASTAPEPSLEARFLGRRIARRRALRTGAVSLTSAAAVVGLAAGVNALADRDEPQPPATASPSPSVTPTPTPTTTPTPEATLPPVTVRPLLPDALPMPPGTFARTGAGWVLVQRSLVTGNGEGDGPIERSYFYLVDPTGTRYEVPFNTDRSVNLVDWLPGTSTAVVQLGGLGDWSSGVSVMDLEAGTFRDLPDGVYGAPMLARDGTVVVAGWDGTVAAYAADGTQVASIDVDGLGVSAADLDPSRTQLAVTVQDAGVRLLTTDLQPLNAPRAATHLDDRACVDATWLDESTLTAACPDGEQPGALQYWTVPLDGAAVVLPVGTTPEWSRLTVVRADGRTYVHHPAVTDPDTGQEITPARLSLIAADGTLVPIEPVLGGLESTGNLLVGWLELGNGHSGDVIALDTRTENSAVVMPVGEGASESPGTNQVAYTTWVAAH